MHVISRNLWRMLPRHIFVAISLCFLLHCDCTETTQLDNGVAGVPQIQCAENSITFSVRTQNLFRGNIYVKGQYGLNQCRQEYGTNDFNGASFSVRIGDCGMRRIRTLSPIGMNYQIVFVVNFHPQFVTKVDRAYNVRCFYAQADRTVTSQLDVSMLPTESLEQPQKNVTQPPNCPLVTKSNFNSQSSVDTSGGDPTRVIGNFGSGSAINPSVGVTGFSTDNNYAGQQGTSGSGSGFNRPIPSSGLQPINPVVNRGNQPIGSSFNVDPSPNLNYGYNQFSSSSVDQSSQSQSSYSGYRSSNLGVQQPNYGYQGQNAGVNSAVGGLQPARPYKKLLDEMKPQAHQPNDTSSQSNSRQKRAAIELARFVPVGTFPNQNKMRDDPVWLEGGAGGAEGGDENSEDVETMDVVAPTLFVADGDDVDPDDPALSELQSPSPGTHKSPAHNSAHPVCLSTAITLLVSGTMGLLLCTVASLLFYVLHLWRRQDLLMKQGGASFASEDRESVGSSDVLSHTSPKFKSGTSSTSTSGSNMRRALAGVLRDAWQRPQPMAANAKLQFPVLQGGKGRL